MKECNFGCYGATVLNGTQAKFFALMNTSTYFSAKDHRVEKVNDNKIK
jgi:hypothetical protein